MIGDKWKPFMGNNHERFPNQDEMHPYRRVSFREFLDKPLNDQLWQMLTLTICPFGLRIYRHTDWQWTDGPIARHVNIYLNEDGDTIRDIQIVL